MIALTGCFSGKEAGHAPEYQAVDFREGQIDPPGECENALPFHEILDVQMVDAALRAAGVTFKERIYTPFVTVCMFPSQVLDPDHSCRAAVARLIVWLVLTGREPCSPDTGSYSDARHRLPVELIAELVRQTARKTDADASQHWLWNERKTWLIDGTTVSTLDTSENQQAFPQANTQKPGVGFPTARLMAIISQATGVVRDLAMGPYTGKETGETALLRTLLDGLEAGEIVVGDRYFASYFLLAALIQRDVDGLLRMHQRRKFDFHRGRRLGPEDHVAAWTKPPRPESMDEETYAQFPNELEIRELRFRVNRAGFRVNELVLVTTMVDGEKYTKEDLANLFLERWNIELDLRSIKDVLRMNILRCMTPEMVKKEIWMHLHAYNLIRGVMAKAAKAHDKQPRRISFKETLQTMAAFDGAWRRTPPDLREYHIQVMVRAISEHQVGDRPGRVEPRANKSRTKAQDSLMETRKQARKRLQPEA